MNAVKDHYRKFDELYGQVPSEVDCPSLSGSEMKAKDKEHSKLLVAAKVRCVIVRVECSKRYAATCLHETENC